jgi:hypothetical protein
MKTIYKFFNLFSKWRFLNDQEKTELIIKELNNKINEILNEKGIY